ncbi:MAG: apolipoprotein N-acyltransferase [Bacteroidetes bacterium]|nr:apolipoprotein N-acyltransferase [Bacteroidota bacterium]
MKRTHRILLALVSALLLSIPFFRWGTGLVMMVAFIPLLFIEDDLAGRKREAWQRGEKARGSVTWYAILTFSIFVVLTTYWVYFATWTGILASVIVNGGYMALTFRVFHYTRKRLGDRLGYASLVIFWLAFEFLYLRAQINFPWLLLGNGFARDIVLIQWYELTGVLGGSLWALVMNLLLYKIIKEWLAILKQTGKQVSMTNLKAAAKPTFQANRSRFIWAMGVFIVPMLFSIVRYLTYEEKEDPYEIVVLQPNIDPYLKFVEMTQDEQTGYLLVLADSLVTSDTEYIVGPETFINKSLWQSNMHVQLDILKLYDFLEDYPRAKLVMGATTYKLYKEPSEFTSTSRPINKDKYRYDSFNSALQLDRTTQIQLYHKSMLVTGVEKMPHANILGILQRLVVKLGGTMRGHGTQAFRDAFVSPQDSTRVGPVICWESVFGEYVTDYVGEAGANFLFIITNDGWWRNTPGHRQHNSYASLRAIENRRSVARSANTGISSLFDQRGKELARCDWWVRSGLRGTLNRNDHITFYVRYGDFLGRIAVLLTVILLLYTIVVRYTRK